MPELDTLTKRAVANALWPKLRANRWSIHRVTRDLSSNGDAPAYQGVSVGHFHHPARALDQDVMHEERYIRAALWAEEWPGRQNLVILLTEAAYIWALRDALPDPSPPTHAASPTTMHAYFLTLTRPATCRVPFEKSSNRHGHPTLRRNAYDPAITPELAGILEAVAQAAEVQVVDDHQVNDALLEDEDIDATAVMATIDRSNREPTEV